MMNVRHGLLVFAATVLTFAASSARAELITNGDFSSGGISNGGFNAANASTYNKWLDVVQWQVDSTTSPGNPFARHNTTTNPNPNHNGNHTNLLFQGFSGAGLTPGTMLDISLDYQFASGGGIREVRLYGFSPTGTLSQFAPWAVSNGSLLSTWALGTTTGWTPFATTYTLPSSYTALVLGIVMSSGNTSALQAGLRAVDNVSVDVVPEPALGLLLVGGLLARSVARRRRS